MGGALASLWRSYRDPRGSMAREIARGLNEPRALARLAGACLILFLASIPAARDLARTLAVEDAETAVIAAHLFAYGIVAPLMAYGLAALIHLAARACGGRGGFLAARAALFRSALLAAPLALIASLAGAVAPSLAPLAGGAAAAAWLWLLAGSLAEAEGFAATGRVALGLGLAGAAMAALAGMLARGGQAG